MADLKNVVLNFGIWEYCNLKLYLLVDLINVLDGQKASNCTSFSMLEEDVAATNVQCSCSTSFVTLKISELVLSFFFFCASRSSLAPVGYYSAVYYLQPNSAIWYPPLQCSILILHILLYVRWLFMEL